jgi:succinyl-diaminopimelate desuccinylase
MSPVLELACDLIARRSVTPEDAGCQDTIAARLASVGFRVERLRFGAVDNLWAEHDAGLPGPTLVYAGHTDVVPSGPEAAWRTPPFEPVVRDGVLSGRGAADMKGSLAAMVVAAEAWVRAHPAHPGRIAFLLTSDEEGVAVDGTVRVVERLAAAGRHLDYCIVGEPSSEERFGDVVKKGRRGSLNGRLVIAGVQGHVAYPHLARNPVHQGLPALAELVAVEWDGGNTDFPPTGLQISNLHAGTGADNVIPGECELLFNFRFSTEQTPERLMEQVETLLRRHGLDYRIDWRLSGLPFLSREGALLASVGAALSEVTGQRPRASTGGGTSDGRFIARICPEVVELGPSNGTIHKVNECVPVHELEALVAVHTGVLDRLLGDRQARGPAPC